MSGAKDHHKPNTQTILLRQPLPKYSFQGRKLPKESPPSKPITSQAGQNVGAQIQQTSAAADLSRSVAPTLGPAAASAQRSNSSATPLTDATDRKSLMAVKPFSSSTTSPETPVVSVGGHKGSRPLAAVVAPNHRGGYQEKSVKIDIGDPNQASQGGSTPGSVVASKGNGGELPLTFFPSPPPIRPECSAIPVPDAALLAHVVGGPTTAEKLEKAEREVEMLKGQLEVQLQVNAEIKRLLVASVGDDFERKVENLARDRAELTMELGGYSKKMTEDYEHLDQISIQADMWRSKYLASRVMVEELAAGRAFYSGQFQDSQRAIQEVLNERYELRANLVHSYKCLQQVKEAFDPFNAQKSHSLPSTNVLDLAKNIKELSESVRFRLLPSHAGAHVMMPLEESWESTMTPAELMAYDQLSKQQTPPSFKHSLPSAVNVMTSSTSYQRYHPSVRHDNVTVNCCTQCKGEILVA